MKDDTYKPISCSFYDRIEAAIVQKKEVELLFRDQNGQSQQETTLLLDTVVRDGKEFVKLENGSEIRMDHILSLDGTELISDTSCRTS